MAIKISNTNVINNDKSFSVIADTTEARNDSPETGMIRYNTSLSQYEFYNGTVWGPIKIDNTNLSAYAWGLGTSGQLGNGTVVDKSSPVSVVGGFTDWVQIAAGGTHSLGLRANGTAWAWGNGNTGRLGDNTIVSTPSPVSVVGGYTDWIQVSAGGGHSLGLRANGTAWAWGNNGFGRLGDGTVVDKSSPVAVVGGFTDWIQVSAGSGHSLGIRASGTAWSWGLGSTGQLGDGTVVDKSSPVSVVGGFTDWIQVHGGSHSLGLRANGRAWAWGFGSTGQLGNGTVVNKSSPVSVVGGFTNWIQVGGFTHSLGLRANGTAWAWGVNAAGQLGDGTVVDKSSPVAVVGGFTDWIQVTGGGSGTTNHSLGLRANGTAWAWGLGASGQLGNNTVVDKSSPVSVVGGYTDWIEISAGNSHILGIR